MKEVTLSELHNIRHCLINPEIAEKNVNDAYKTINEIIDIKIHNGSLIRNKYQLGENDEST